MNRTSTAKDKRETSRLGEAQTRLIEPQPDALTLHTRGVPKYGTFTWRDCVSHQTPWLCRWHRKEKPSYVWFSKSAWIESRKIRAIGNKDSTPEGLISRPYHYEVQCQPTEWKLSRQNAREMHLLILKALPERQETAGSSSRDGSPSKQYILSLIP